METAQSAFDHLLELVKSGMSFVGCNFKIG